MQNAQQTDAVHQLRIQLQLQLRGGGKGVSYIPNYKNLPLLRIAKSSVRQRTKNKKKKPATVSISLWSSVSTQDPPTLESSKIQSVLICLSVIVYTFVLWPIPVRIMPYHYVTSLLFMRIAQQSDGLSLLKKTDKLPGILDIISLLVCRGGQQLVFVCRLQFCGWGIFFPQYFFRSFLGCPFFRNERERE